MDRDQETQVQVPSPDRRRRLYWIDALWATVEKQKRANTAFTKFKPALRDRIADICRLHGDLEDGSKEVEDIRRRLEEKFNCNDRREPGDATAGAVCWVVYVYSTNANPPMWKLKRTEVLLSKLFSEEKCLAECDENFKQETGAEKYERRWIHLPGNNMEWVESTMRRVIEGFIRKIPEIAIDERSKAVDRVLGHVLHSKRWIARQNDSSPHMLHARYMIPLAQQFTAGSPSYGREFKALSKRSFVVFMPYLSWERSTVALYRNMVYRDACDRAERDHGCVPVPSSRTAEQSSKIHCCEREALLRNYIFAPKPLHLRRTLDQSYYTIMKDTRRRDADQVVERYAHKQTHWKLADRLDPCILMVDHLWMWTLNADTFITCYPRLWNHEHEFEGSDLFGWMQERIENKLNRRDTKSGKTRLGRLITEACAMYMSKSAELSADASANISANLTNSHQFMRFFEDTLRKILDEKSRILRDSSCDMRSAEAQQNENFIQTTEEFKPLAELMDLIDEAQMILDVIKEQIALLQKFDKDLVRTRTTNRDDAETEWPVLKKLKADEQFWEKKILQQAVQARSEIQNLLELKQQRAIIRLASDTSNQSNAVMIFTLVTIFFLPISTLASLFGVNASNFGQGDVPLSTIFACIFPISSVTITIAICLAFNPSIRHCVTLMTKIVLFWLRLDILNGISDKFAKFLETYLDRFKIAHQEDETQRGGGGGVREDNLLVQSRRNTMLQQESEQAVVRAPENWACSTEYANEFEKDSNFDLREDGSTQAGTDVDA